MWVFVALIILAVLFVTFILFMARDPLRGYKKVVKRNITSGKDLWNIQASPADCASRCNNFPECKGFTYKGEQCWGKTSPVTISNPDFVTYLRPGSSK